MSQSKATTFGAADYAVFGIMLAISSCVGIYYAIQNKRKSKITAQYLAAPRKMHYIPVALSLSVTFTSAISILGNPAEIYTYGFMYWWLTPSFLIAAVIISEIYIPLYYRLEITSSYEYLEMRFNRVVRILVTSTFIVQTIMYAGIVIYAPALALSQVTGFNLWAAVLSTGLICTFYTTLGGLNGVIWSDVFQIMVMLIGLLAVVIRGSILMGGIGNIWQISAEGGRLNMGITDPDPRLRNSIWTLLVGGTFVWLSMYSVSQSQIQSALYLNALGLLVIFSLICFNGLVAYAYFFECDPFSTGKISSKNRDRLLPYMVMEMFAEYPGVPGIFGACVFSGGLSTISTGINAMACVTVEDFIKPCTKWTDKMYGWVSRGLGLFYGLLCIVMAYTVHELGAVLQAALSIFGIVGGPLIGVFSLGILLPFANSWGAIAGLFFGLACTSTLYTGALEARKSGTTTQILNKLPISTNGCPSDYVNQTMTSSLNATTSLHQNTTSHESLSMAASEGLENSVSGIVDFYSISYLYYGCVGFLATFSIGIVVSLITCGWRQRKSVKPKLLRPFFDHWVFRLILSEPVRRFLRFGIDWEDNNQPEYDSKMMVAMSGSRISYKGAFESK